VLDAKNHNLINGFTLVEFLMVITIAAVAFALIIPAGLDFYYTHVLDQEVNSLTNNLKKAQGQAIAGLNNSSYGVKFQENQYVLFRGDSYEDRVEEEDVVYQLSSGVEVVGVTEVVFEKHTGQAITIYE